jgi:hypothetical protein
MQLALTDVESIVERSSAPVLKGHTITRVVSTPAFDVYGNEYLNVTIVVDEFKIGPTGEGHSPLDVMIAVQQALQGSGEDRLAVVSIISEANLAEYGDPEP